MSIEKTSASGNLFNSLPDQKKIEKKDGRITSIARENLGHEVVSNSPKLSSHNVVLLKPSSTSLLNKIWNAVYYVLSFLCRLVCPFIGIDDEHRKYEKYRDYSTEILKGFDSTQVVQPNLTLLNQESVDALKKLEEAHQCLVSASLPGDVTDCRANFKRFLSIIRQVMDTQSYQQDPYIQTMANRYCFAMYTQVNISRYTQKIVLNASQYQPQPNANLEQQLQQFLDIHDSISSATHLITPYDLVGQSIRGHLGDLLGFDPNMQGGPPYQKFKLNVNQKEAVNIRIATPTIGNNINPEFKGYLQFLRQVKKKHLYINLQQASKEALPGENERSESLKQLSKEAPYNEVLTLVTLDKNSDFYFQKNKFADKENAQEFKDTFLHRMFSDGDGFYMPDQIQGKSREELQGMIKDLVDGIHANFFGNRDVLTKEERQNFIELTYNLLISNLVAVSQADYYNNSCKDCIDRGGATSALMAFSIEVLKENKANPAEKASVVTNLSLMFSDAILVRKRSIISERMDRALGALEVLFNASSDAKDWMYNQMGSPSIDHV